VSWRGDRDTLDAHMTTSDKRTRFAIAASRASATPHRDARSSRSQASADNGEHVVILMRWVSLVAYYACGVMRSAAQWLLHVRAAACMWMTMRVGRMLGMDMDLSPDGTMLAICPRNAAVWSVTTGRPTGPHDALQCGARDGNRCGSGSGGGGGHHHLRPVANIRIHRPERFWPAIALGGTLGIGTAYIQGDWSCGTMLGGERDGGACNLTEVCRVVLGAGCGGSTAPLLRFERLTTGWWRDALRALTSLVCNPQSIARSKRVAQLHYDAGNDLYEAMLGPTMNYSCAVWPDMDGTAGFEPRAPSQAPCYILGDRHGCAPTATATATATAMSKTPSATLDDAQMFKMELLCRKLDLRSGMCVLDIGCGWGGLMRYMTDQYGVQVVGVTISSEQKAWCAAHHADLDVVLEDYRTYCARNPGRFNRVVSVGAMEHIGRRNWRTYMRCAHGVLRQDDPSARFVVQTIGVNRRRTGTNAFLDRFVFPGGELPSLGEVADACVGLFHIERLDNYGPHYARTLAAWRDRLERTHFGAGAPGTDVSEDTKRMWRLYLSGCEAAFLTRHLQLWQMVLQRVP